MTESPPPASIGGLAKNVKVSIQQVIADFQVGWFHVLPVFLRFPRFMHRGLYSPVAKVAWTEEEPLRLLLNPL